MYKDFYHMKTEPFGTLPSPDIFFASESHQAAWDYLVKGMELGQSPLLVTGPHGTGKTLLCLKLVQQLTQNAYHRFVYCPVPTSDFRFILRDLAQRLSVPVTEDNESAIQYAIYSYFRESSDRTCVYLILDDAQAIDSDTLEKIFFFANFNHQFFFPFRLILFGRTSLCEKLASLHLDALLNCRQRSFSLNALDPEEIREYIYFRLLVTEAPGVPSFTDDAINDIYNHSLGTPLLVNAICNACLILGAQRGMTVIDRTIVSEARVNSMRDVLKKIPEETAEHKFTELRTITDTADRPLRQTSEKEYSGTIESKTAPQKTGLLRNTLLLVIAAALIANALIFYALLIKTGTDTAGTALKMAEKRESSTTTHKKSTTTTVEQARDKIDKTGLKDGISEQAPFGLITKPAAAVKTETSTTSFQQTTTTSVEPALKTKDKTILKDNAGKEIPSGVIDKPAATVSPSTTTTVSTAFNTLPVQQITTTVSSPKAAQFPYTLQLACYNDEKVTREETLPFKRSGLAPFIVKSFSNRTGETLWVIYAGYYATAEEAERGKNKNHLSEAIAARTPYAVLIGTFASAEEITKVTEHLEQFKYYTYTIPDKTGKLNLFAGAFSTRSGAEQLYSQLQKDGIKGQVVLR
jgi:type II secretory pathway predicted ATPase ExeA